MTTRTPIALVAATLALLASTGCTYDEGFVVQNMTGKVVVPRAAATRMMLDEAGNTVEVTDSRLIGPVYLGLFPSVRENLLEYPHPEIGPVFQPGIPGDTYPYGGTSLGDFRNPCVEDLTCRVASGRFIDFDDLLSWFRVRLDDPVVDRTGNTIETGDVIRQACYDQLNYTTDDEIRLTALDENGDDVIDEKDLDFQENADGDFEADFIIWQADYFEGMALWGWMDAPSEDGFRFSTCNDADGYQEQEYTSDYRTGAQHRDLLNQPSTYIGPGDWTVSSGGWHVYETVNDEVIIRFDHEVLR